MELPVQIGKEIHIIRIGVVYDCVNDIHAGIGDGAARQRRAAVCVIGIIRITRNAVIQQIFCIIISYVTLQARAAVQPISTEAIFCALLSVSASSCTIEQSVINS